MVHLDIAILLSWHLSSHLQIVLYDTGTFLSLLAGLPFPQNIVGNDKYSESLSINIPNGLIPSPGAKEIILSTFSTTSGSCNSVSVTPDGIRIRGDISRSSNGVKFNRSGYLGKLILLALEKLGSLPFVRFESQFLQIHSVFSTLLTPVTQDSTRSCEHALYLLALHFTTEDLYHNWSQQVHMYSGPHLMFS